MHVPNTQLPYIENPSFVPLLDAAGPVHDDVIVSVGAVHGEQQVPLTVPSEEEPLCHPECYAGLGGSHVCVYGGDG